MRGIRVALAAVLHLRPTYLFRGRASTFRSSSQRRPALALPHLGIQDLRAVDWAALKQAGFKAAIFDKDNTLTVPYAMDLEPGPATALQTCQQVFGRRQVALFSNSAGLAQFDPKGECPVKLPGWDRDHRSARRSSQMPVLQARRRSCSRWRWGCRCFATRRRSQAVAAPSSKSTLGACVRLV